MQPSTIVQINNIEGLNDQKYKAFMKKTKQKV